MIFSTFEFILIFLPIVLILYTLAKRNGYITAAKGVLVLGSLYFYAYGSGTFFYFYVGSVLFNYLTGYVLSTIHEKQNNVLRKTVLTIGILANVVLLGYYKYADFFIANFNFLTRSDIPFLRIILPIGISFFTFQLIAYLVDSYRGETKDYVFIDYLLFINFFPQLIVGPIVHHKDVVPQFNAMQKEKFNYDLLSFGIFLFFMGCTKKLVLADPLTTLAQKAFDNAQELNLLESWVAGLSYTISYYFDLSGYADMAIGLGAMFGITIPDNFNSPYKANNFAEYWRRWHMTLSKFLGDYIFRSIYKKGGGSKLFYFATFITFLVSGFWHGSGWTFVVWGILNGIFVMLAHYFKRANITFPFLLAWGATFFGVIVTRILFVSSTFSDSYHVLTTMFNPKMFSLSCPYIGMLQPFYIIAGLIITLFFPNSIAIRSKFKPNVKYLLITTFFIVISFLNMNKVGDFLYFQF